MKDKDVVVSFASDYAGWYCVPMVTSIGQVRQATLQSGPLRHNLPCMLIIKRMDVCDGRWNEEHAKEDIDLGGITGPDRGSSSSSTSGSSWDLPV